MSYALVFPGQGSQYVGMGRELVQWSEEARRTFEEADDVLGISLSGLCFDGPEEGLKLTENTQPAILTASVAALRALSARTNVAPAFVAGHSLGEYTALVAAGSLSFSDAVAAVRERGVAMQAAVPAGEGAMAALLGMDREDVLEVCREASAAGGVAAAANFNAPGQIVIAGHRSNVLAAMDLYRERGGRRAVELPVSAPFHCALMKPAARRMEEVLRDIHIDSPKTVLINNAQAKALTQSGQIVPSLIRQVTSPVLWEDSVRAMIGRGVTSFLEVGPGKVLTGLAKRIDKQAAAHSFASPEDIDGAVACLGGE
ncbi:MAG: ACP S-malonyltransferase [bacterium]|nr:ACP S-malonyltransferase [bacterium]